MPEYKKLDSLRQQIDDIDEQIIDLLSHRLKLTAEIGVVKSKMKKPVIDKEREADLNARLDDLCRQRGLDSDFVLKIWQTILHESYRAQDADK
jgi:chorismate mutase